MPKRRLIYFILLIIGAPPTTIYAQKEYVYKLLISQCKVGDDRTQTGFRMQDYQGVITALHGVVGCKDIKMRGDVDTPALPGNFELAMVDVANDVALLTTRERSLPPVGLQRAQGSVDWAHAGVIWIIGYPNDVQSSFMRRVTIGIPASYIPNTTLPSIQLAGLQERGSPDPGKAVVNIDSTILPGHSGAPLIDSNNRVVAVGNGGLSGGTAGLNWAIPWSSVHLIYLQDLNPETKTKLASLEVMNPDTLFSFGKDSAKELAGMGFHYDFDTFFKRVALGDTKVVGLFLKAGIRPDEVDEGSKKSALMLATENNDTEMMSLLIRHDVHVDAKGKNGATALMVAARKGFYEAVDILLKAKADPNAKDLQNRTALHYAAWGNSLTLARGHGDVVRLLIEAKADVNSRDDTGTTPLIAAVYVAGLRRAGSDVEAGRAIVRALVAAKADVTAKNAFGYGPSDVGATSEIRRLLAEAPQR
jgi:ankyrin repeat protein